MNRCFFFRPAGVAALVAALFVPLISFATTINPVPVQTVVHTLSGVYGVQVDDGAGNNVAAVDVNKHWVEYPIGTTHSNVYYTHFSFGNGSARVKVTLLSLASNDTTATYKLSPTSYNVPSSKSGNVITFTLTDSRYMMLKVTDPANTYPFYLVIAADKLETNVPPSSGTGIYNITASPYNAVGNYTTNAAPALQSALNDASSYSIAHGGTVTTVYVPSGAYKIAAPTVWASNVNLYLAPGAVLRVDTNQANWPAGNPSRLLKLNNVSNVKIFGRGTLDCAGVAFGGNVANKQGTSGYHLAAAMQIWDSSQVTVDGIVLRESTGWMFSTDRCDHITKTNLKVINYAQDPAKYREDDGIDLMQCQDSSVSHCLVFSADDACCMKGAYDGSDTGTGGFEHVLRCNYSDLVIFSNETGLKYGLQAYTDITESYFRNIDIIFAVRALGVNAWRGNTFWDKLAFLDIRCENIGSRPMEFTIKQDYGSASEQGYSNVAQLAVVDFTCPSFGPSQSDLNGYTGTGGTPVGNFDRVTFANLNLAGAARTSFADANIRITDPADSRVIAPTNVSFSSYTEQLHPTGGALTASGSSTNWKTGANDITMINDGSTVTEAQATNTSDTWVTYNFVSDTAMNHVRINKDNGTYSVGTWKLERWDQHLATPAWVTIFDFTACPTDGWNDVYFSTVIGTGVRLTFHPSGTGSVGVNQVEVYGVKLQ